jgi:hypothetical protein
VKSKDDSLFAATASVNSALRFHVVINTQPSRSFKLPFDDEPLHKPSEIKQKGINAA